MRFAFIFKGDSFMKTFLSKAKSNFFTWFPWAFLCFAFLATFAGMYLFGREYIDADMSAEMVLANLMNEEGSLISENWWYSNQIHLFYLQLFYCLTLRIFPNDWYLARMVGQALWMIALIASFVYLCSKKGLGLKNNGAWGAACLACPFGLFYFWYGFYAGAYLPNMILFLLALGLIVHLMHEAPLWRKVIQIACLVGLSFVSGVNSVKGMMSLFAPLMLASIVLLLYTIHREDGKPKKALRLLLFSGIGILADFAGLLFNSLVLAKIYDLPPSSLQWREFNILDIFGHWGGFLTLFGWQYPADFWPIQNNLFSLDGLLGGFGYLLICALILAIFRVSIHFRELSFEKLLVIVLFLSVLLVQGSIFAYTDAANYANATYWLPFVPFAFVLFQVAIETEHFKTSWGTKAAAMMLILCVGGSGVSSFRSFFAYPLRSEPNAKPVCDWLVSQGYENGYVNTGEFWYANIFTEWSSGQIDMYVMTDEMLTTPNEWLQKKSHKNPAEGNVFILVTPEYVEYYERLYSLSNIVYKDDEGFLVLVYESYDEMQQVLAQAYMAE